MLYAVAQSQGSRESTNLFCMSNVWEEDRISGQGSMGLGFLPATVCVKSVFMDLQRATSFLPVCPREKMLDRFMDE